MTYEILKISKHASDVYFDPRSTEVRGTLADFKVAIITAVYQNQIIAYQILPRNQMVNHNVYLTFLTEYLQPEVRRKRIRTPLIIHDNATPHKHADIVSFFARHRWVELKHPAYSPDLNPCDYDLYHRIKGPHKGFRFATVQDLIRAYTSTIEKINRNS